MCTNSTATRVGYAVLFLVSSITAWVMLDPTVGKDLRKVRISQEDAKTEGERKRKRDGDTQFFRSPYYVLSLSLSFALSIISMTQYAYHQNAHPTPYLERRGRKSFLWERRKMKLSFMHTYLTLFFSFLPALAFSFMAYKLISIRSRYGLLSVFLSYRSLFGNEWKNAAFIIPSFILLPLLCFVFSVRHSGS
jgi:hypothetical protein